MKRIVLFTVILTLISAMSLSFADPQNYGATGALEHNNYTLAEMLTYAIQDEYTALAEYELIMSQYGTIRPFSNISESESTHIRWLEPLFEKYNIDLPLNESDQIVIMPSSLTEAYKTGINAEVANIAMYEAFLQEDLPEDVKTVFESLKNASENHLEAFNNQVDRSTRFRRNQ